MAMSEAFQRLNLESWRWFRTGKSSRFAPATWYVAGTTAQQEHKVLSGMARRGLAARVRRGLYLLPAVLPLGGRWSPGERWR